MDQLNTVSIVVIGTAGQGKSSLINSILGQEMAKVGDDMDGVTKNISQYETIIKENNLKLILYDLPGFGDVDIGVDELAKQWNTVLENKQINLIFFCQQISNVRMDMITRTSLNIMFKSLKNPMIEKSFVIVITQTDLKSDEEINKFKNEFVSKQLIPKLKDLMNATEINQVIYTSNKKKQETMQQVQQLCMEYLNDKRILRIGLLGELQSGKTTFKNIFSETPSGNHQQGFIQSYLTKTKYLETQIEFQEIQFQKDQKQEDIKNEWTKWNGSKKLNLLFIFIKQSDDTLDILQQAQLSKYQSILEYNQLHESYCIVLKPNNLQNLYIKQKEIEGILKTNNIVIPQKHQFLLINNEENNIKSRFDFCLDSYHKARQQQLFAVTTVKKMTDQIIQEAQQETRKKAGKDCISLDSKILTNSGYIDISKLQVGQSILVKQQGRIKADNIIGFIHQSAKEYTKFIKIIFQNQTYVTLTPKHLLKQYQSSFIQAQFVKKGDLIERYNGKEIYSDQVTEIQPVFEYGYTCPISHSGELIINECIVSCYSNCSQKVGDIFTWPFRKISLIRHLFKQNGNSDEIHPYFKLLLWANRHLNIAIVDE